MQLNRIINADCLKAMKDIPDGSVDAIITDLLYGTTRNQWDSIIPLDQLWEQYKRVTKPNAAIVLFSQQPFTSALVMSNPNMFRYEWIWQKENGTGHLNAKKIPMKDHENIIVFYDALPTYNPQMTLGEKNHHRGAQSKISNNCYGKFGTVKETFTNENIQNQSSR